MFKRKEKFVCPDARVGSDGSVTFRDDDGGITIATRYTNDDLNLKIAIGCFKASGVQLKHHKSAIVRAFDNVEKYSTPVEIACLTTVVITLFITLGIIANVIF